MKKKIITIVIIVAVLLLLGGFYLWYNGNYAGKKSIELTTNPVMEYEWQKMASDNGIVGDYLWQRTREYLVNECGSDGLIPSSYMIPGRLTTQPGQSSEEFLLEDQALLLKMYVKANERIAAINLKKTVEANIDISAQNITGRMAWLDACVSYYDAFGSKKDYEDILGQINNLFDENGEIIPESLYAATYQQGAFTAMNDNGDVTAQDVNGTLSSPVGESEAEMFAFEGVSISSINLRLIKDLENNGLLPSGSYELNLSLVKNAIVSNTIHLYAYAYTYSDGQVSYIYAYKTPAAIDVTESIRTMLNLQRVNELPEDCYIWIKNNIVNSGRLKSTYYLVTGSTDGAEAVDAYIDILEISYLHDDRDLFERICTIEGIRVATYTNSPALSMVYREEDGRYVLYARENLGLSLMIY